MVDRATPSPAPAAPHVVILTTGGTISASTSTDGVIRSDPTRGAPLLPAHLAAQLPGDLHTETRAVVSKDSSQLDDGDRLSLCHAIAAALANPAVTGVVVTHGTDSLADSALLADLYHRDERPVVFTGAQRPADHPAPDGPANLFDALQVVLSPTARGVGVLVVFGRAVLQARGVAKWHTTDELAFARNAPEDTAAEARAAENWGAENSAAATTQRTTFALPTPRTALPHVEALWAGSGTSATALQALIHSGVDGYVLIAMGLGNVPAAIAEVACAHPSIPVVVTSAVPRGAVTAAYGGPGGGADLVARGAIPSRWLRGGQARIALLAVLAHLGTDAPTSEIAATYHSLLP